jgi:hypothetical protein
LSALTSSARVEEGAGVALKSLKNRDGIFRV